LIERAFVITGIRYFVDPPIPYAVGDGIKSSHVITHYRTRVYIYGRVHVCAFARARKGLPTHAEIRICIHTDSMLAHACKRCIGRISYSRCQIDLVYLNRYPVPFLLKIGEREREREKEESASGYRPGFSAGKSWRGRVFTQDTTIHYVIELNEPSPRRPSPSEAFDSNVYACECSGTRVRGLQAEG